MFLICGLGNPGKKYFKTRHNIGFVLIEKLISNYNFVTVKKDKKKELTTVTLYSQGNSFQPQDPDLWMDLPIFELVKAKFFYTGDGYYFGSEYENVKIRNMYKNLLDHFESGGQQKELLEINKLLIEVRQFLNINKTKIHTKFNGHHSHLLEHIPPGLNYSFFTEKLGHPQPIFSWRSKFSDYLYKLQFF